MEYYNDDFNWDDEARRYLYKNTVGAATAMMIDGIGRYRPCHNATTLEQTSIFEELGAGIQTTADAARILWLIGLLEKSMDEVKNIKSELIKRWQNKETEPHV